MGIKKKIFFTWVALEVVLLPVSIPATAQIVDRIAFSVQPRIAAVELEAEPGMSRYIVASNAPFAVISEGAIGQIDVDIKVHGNLNKTPFGTKAQSPGPKQTCTTSISGSPNIIYTADRKTAAKRGEILQQAVMVEMRYDPAMKPTLRFEAAKSQ
ncbi:MAG: hypothetical protein EX271_07000, partial [Acidimicrobiales bacterium]